MHRPGKDSIVISSIAIAIVVGKIMSAGAHEPRARDDVRLVTSEPSAAAADSSTIAPVAVVAKAPAPDNGATGKPVQSAACTPPVQDASNGNAAAVSAQPGEALLTSQCASPLSQP